MMAWSDNEATNLLIDQVGPRRQSTGGWTPSVSPARACAAA